MFDIVTIGHFSIDFILTAGAKRPRKRLGGPPTYTSISARKLDASVSVVSRVGGDFPDTYIRRLMREGVDLSRLKIDGGSRTTSFLIKYRADGERDMFLLSRAQPIALEDLRGIEAKAMHISPIANEITLTLIREVAESVPLVSLDPQGLLRGFSDDGRVFLHGIDDLSFLRYVSVLKASKEELRAMTGIDDAIRALRKVMELGVGVAIVTVGVSGAFVSTQDGVFYIPAAQPRRFVDPTGAGDSFMGGFLAEYLRGGDVLWCASVGSSAASYVVEEVGSEGFKGRRKVYERARWVYEKIVKVSM